MSEKVCFDKRLLNSIEDYNIDEVLKFIKEINEETLEVVESKDKDYGGSWQKDGLISVHLNTKRKWDRLQNMFENGFSKLSNTDETLEDTLKDLRNYVSLYLYFVNKKKLSSDE